MRVQKLFRIVPELLREQLHVRFYRSHISLVRVLAEHLRGQFRRVFRADIHYPAVHSGTAEIPHRTLLFIADAEDDYAPAGLIFREEIPGLAADDHERLLLHILLHVNARAVARRAFHKYLPVAHSVACRVADIAVNSDRAVVHCVTHSVLRVAVNGDVALGQIRAESIAGNARNVDILAGAAASRVALAEHIFYLNFSAFRAADFFVQLPKAEIFGIYFHYAAPPFASISCLFSFANAANCGALQSRS